MRRTFLPSLAPIVIALATAACSGGSGGGDTGPLTFADCEAIVDACHDVDDGSGGMPTICHDTAHDADSNDDCAPIRAACVSACSMLDGGVHADEDAGHSH